MPSTLCSSFAVTSVSSCSISGVSSPSASAMNVVEREDLVGEIAERQCVGHQQHLAHASA
jgi:hypothetical protein